MKIIILLLLVDHAQLETAVQGLDKGGGGCGNFLVYVVDLVLHGVELLPEQLDQLVVLLKILVCLSSQVLI